jgi:protease-4
LLVLVWGGRAAAQTGGDLPDATFRATRGPFLPGAARAGDADATAVEMNPGQLPLLRTSAAAAVANVWGAGAVMPGRGAGVMLASPVWGGGGIGVGLHGVAGSDAGPLVGHTKFQLAYGIGGRTFGMGVSWAHLFGGGYGGTDTFDVGLGWRPFSRAALGLVVEDVLRPRLPDQPDRLPRRWAGELALRPAGTDRVELAAAAIHVEDDAWSRLGTRFRGVARVYGPFGLLADVELGPRRPGAAPAADGVDWRLTAGLIVNLDRGALALGTRRAFTPDGVGGELWGATALVRTSAERNPDGIAPAQVIRVVLRGGAVDSDREFVALAMRLRALSGDRNASAVLFRIEDVELGYGRIEELRDLITEIRLQGKPVVAYLASPGMRELYLASACDRIVMHPAGALTFAGLAQTVTFYKGAMDRLGVNVDLVRIAEFKGAMEPFVMTGQSEPVRRNREAHLNDVYNRIMARISEARLRAAPEKRLGGGQHGRLGDLVAVGTFTPIEALQNGLVDAVADDTGMERLMRELIGRPSIAVRDADPSPVRPRRWTRGRVAVVLVDGTIVAGSSRQFPMDLGGVAGSDSLVEALDECRRDPTVRAVVLRVNSPGGSAFGSDVVARKVRELRAAGKPVVASFGDIAASGGYYVAAPADFIFAEQSTLTGSIGVFGFKLDLSRLLDTLAIRSEVYRTAPHADAMSPYRPWSPDERRRVEQKMRHLYQLFVATVAEGRQSRGLSPVRVDQLGRGQIWTGAAARAQALVDAFGGVMAAIDWAANVSALPNSADEPAEVMMLPRPRATALRQLMELGEAGSETTVKAPLLPADLRAAARMLAPYLFGASEGVEARLPFDMDIR